MKLVHLAMNIESIKKEWCDKFSFFLGAKASVMNTEGVNDLKYGIEIM